ncbi:MAG: recombinase family protein, partial [Staphylococcus epidermidis]|nr:recombinase family protein [Staphylococcus epidermidis]
MKQLKKKRIGLYARVSTEMQTDGYSIHGQLNQLTEYCQFQGYEV